MSVFRFLPRLALAALAGLVAQAASAQTTSRPSHAVPETVVTATRIETPIDKLGGSVTVITREDIERRQYDNVVDVLRDVPGMSVQQTGGAGRVTSVFTRGGNSNHTLVLIDGVRVNDMSDPSNVFNFGNLTTAGIDRIEILRGPMSTVHGSDAIGGVVNIVTSRGKGAPAATIAAEAGSFHTFAEQANLRGAQGRFGYNFTVGRFDTKGTSVTPRRRDTTGKGHEADGYHNTTLNGRFDAELNDTVDLTLFTRYTGANGENDATVEDPNSRDANRYLLNKLQGSADLLDGAWRPTLAISRYSVQRIDANYPDNFSTTYRYSRNTGDRDRVELQNDIVATDGMKFAVGGELQHETFASREITSTSNRPNKASSKASAGYVQGQFEKGDANLATGVRLDQHNAFGQHVTWRASPSLYVRETDTRLKAAYGRGYKAPSLYQLYARTQFFTGNPALAPERSQGWEAGVEQGFGKTVKAGTTYFKTQTTNLIVSNSAFTSNINLGSANMHGFESFVAWNVLANVSLRLDHTYQHSEDASNGQELLRRPKHKIGLGADWQVSDDWEVGAGLQYSGLRADIDADTSGRTYPDGYWIGRATTSYRLSPTWRAFGRMENAFNRAYEEPSGFAQPPRAIFAGLRASF
jgi:vitamin B12 transporter